MKKALKSGLLTLKKIVRLNNVLHAGH
jgi:hypothetical protein